MVDPAPQSLEGGGASIPGRTDGDLLAALLLSKRNREGRAASLLKSCGGLPGLIQVDWQVARAQGLSSAETASLLAVIELARRLQPEPSRSEILEDPERVARYLFVRHASPSQEVLGAVYFDAEERNVGEMVHFRGTRWCCAVGVRHILSAAVRRHTRSLLVFHNHPSGNLTPSKADLLFTGRLLKACEAIGLTLIDHLILGAGGCLSLRRSHLRWVDLDPGVQPS